MDFMDKEKDLTNETPGDSIEGASARGEGAGSQGVEPGPARAGSVAARVPTDPEELAAAYEKAVAEKRDLHDRLLRKQAEIENVRKRLQREKEDFLQHATADLVRALLPTLDGFERALKHSDPNVPEQFTQGIELIYRQLLDVLERAGLTPIETQGKLFDPHVHQAVETLEDPERRDHEIVEELQRGYKLKHRLLRPAIVKVAVNPQDHKKEKAN
jgi:molecular chaperone GrpE